MYGVYIRCNKFEEYFVEIERDGEKRQYEVKGRQGLFNVLPEKTVPFKLHLSFVRKNLSCDQICDYIENSGLREITIESEFYFSKRCLEALFRCKYLKSVNCWECNILDNEIIMKILENKNIRVLIGDWWYPNHYPLVDKLLRDNLFKRKSARVIAITAFLCLKPILGKDLSRKIAEMIYYDF